MESLTYYQMDRLINDNMALENFKTTHMLSFQKLSEKGS